MFTNVQIIDGKIMPKFQGEKKKNISRLYIKSNKKKFASTRPTNLL